MPTRRKQRASRFGELIKRLRDERRLTQEELARVSGVDQTYISALEAGRRKNPSLDVLAALARAFDMEPAEFAAMVYPPKRPESLSTEEAEVFLSAYGAMSPEERANVLEFMEFVRSRRRRQRRAGGEGESA